MKKALIGHTGFVGSNLVHQTSFDICYNSQNISQIENKSFDLVVCSGIQAKKWWANANAEEDWAGIKKLLDLLRTVRVSKFVLISTVDVYPNPKGVNENSSIEASENHPYGKHRYRVEEFVREIFADHLILRLPGLFGRGIKKNVIHDLLNDHELEKINPLGVFQYYYLKHLWPDITKASELNLKILNLATEAIPTREILEHFFPHKAVGQEQLVSANYDMRSCYGQLWDSPKPEYLYCKEKVMDDLSDFITSYTKN